MPVVLLCRHATERTEMPSITPFLWFDDQAEEAAKLHTSIFPNSRIVETRRYENASPDGSTVTIVTYEVDGSA